MKNIKIRVFVPGARRPPGPGCFLAGHGLPDDVNLPGLDSFDQAFFGRARLGPLWLAWARIVGP